MPPTDLFHRFDAHCRRAGLGGGVSETLRRDGCTAYLGQWFYIAHWSFSAQKAPEIVRSVIAEAAALAKPVMWRVYDRDRPETLAGILEAYGFAPVSSDALLVYDLNKPVSVPRFDAIRVRSNQDLDEYLEILSVAFEQPMTLSAERREALLESETVLTFVSSDGDGLLAAGQMDMAEDNPAVLLRGGSTLPEKRGQGGYASMVRSRLILARDQHKELAFVEAVPASRSILLYLGFEEVCRGKTWTFRHVQENVS